MWYEIYFPSKYYAIIQQKKKKSTMQSHVNSFKRDSEVNLFKFKCHIYLLNDKNIINSKHISTH